MFAKKDTVGGYVWRRPINLSEKDFEKLELSGNVQFSFEQRKKITAVIDEFISRKMVLTDSPDAKSVIDRAEKILKLSEEMEAFFDVSSNLEKIDETLIHRIKTIKPYWDIECDLSGSQFSFLNMRLKKSIKYLSIQSYDRNGPEGDDIFNNLIFNLLKIYKEVSQEVNKRKKKGTGQLHLLQTVLEIMPSEYRPHIHGEDALKQRIKRISAKIKQSS